MSRTSGDEWSAPSPAPPGRPERRIYLDSVMAQLWSRPGQTSNETSHYRMLPSARVPTLVVPRRPRRATASLIRSYKSSAGPLLRFTLQGLALAARLGVTDLLPSTTSVTTGWGSAGPPENYGLGGGDLDIVSYLESALNRPLCVGLYTSPPRANRKPVLSLVSPRGELVGFVKIGTSSLTRDLVTHEAQALQRMEDATLKRLLVPPLLLHATWRDYVVLVQGALQPRGHRSPSRALVVAAMRELSEVEGVGVESVVDGPYVTRLEERMAGLPDTAMAARLRVALSMVRSRRSHGQMRVGAWHGDWTPWNMGPAAQRIALWDWERLEFGVPVGFDLLHYDLQTLIVREGCDPSVAARSVVGSAPELLAEMGTRTSPQEARLVSMLYLLEMGTRYLHDRQKEAGAKLGDLNSWLLPTLDDALEAMARDGHGAAG